MSTGAKVVAAAAVVLLVVSGAFWLISQPPPVTSGTVVAKTDHPAYDWIYNLPVPHEMCVPLRVGNTTTQDCVTYYTYIPIPEHQSEQWSLTLKSCKDDKCRTGEVYVSASDYGSTKIGDFVP